MPKYKTFKVLPSVPEKLQGLYDVAYNVWLTWNPDAIKLFLRLDEELWNAVQHNPVRMLGEISQKRLEEMAQDEGYVLEVARLARKLKDYINGVKLLTCDNAKECSIAYFSLEYGLTEAVPIYSGGLGVLSGDHIKSASDIGLNLTGIGLLYQYGYFQQYLNQDGWQQDFYKPNDFDNMQVSEVYEADGRPMEIQVELPERIVRMKIWKLMVGRVTIYLMDTNIPQAQEGDRRLTAQLYGGDRELRLQQEIILGIGGVRLLDRLGIEADVIHMNEGHSSFAVFERARMFMKKNNLTFPQAMEITRKTNVFTTHTPVPAGNDEFVPELVRRYFREYAASLGVSLDEFLGFGRINPYNNDENFSMPVLAIRNSAYINGVSQLHGEVSRNMWRALWPEVPPEHVPIKGLTNGVHMASWLSFEFSELFRRYLGDTWQEKQDSVDLWKKIYNIPAPEIWRVHNVRRRRLVYFIRDRLKAQLTAKGAPAVSIDEAEEALNPEALTIGFARRFATYKRGSLLFRDLPRLMEILNNHKRPVQIIFAGKAHPQDHAGKEIIKSIFHIIHSNKLLRKIVFIEDYDMNVARYMVQGVDVWLNNPLRPHEASGTSGMKAAANGVLNLSVMDGWWDEAYNHSNGWSIGNGESYNDRNYQDEVESKDIYSILDNVIVPMFYDRDEDELPRGWINMMKNSFNSIVPVFNTHRMVKEYFNRFYKNAGKNFLELSNDNFKALKELIAWKDMVKNEFRQVRVADVHFEGNKKFRISDEASVAVDIFPGKLKPEDISVDIYYGNVSIEDQLENSAIEPLRNWEPIGDGKYRFSGRLICRETGSIGFRVRITPFHPLIIDPYEMNMVIWE